MYYSYIGVESATLKGDDKNQIEVTGDGIDAAELTRLLRKPKLLLLLPQRKS